MRWLRFLFPYRAHLEAEVEYLRGQLAQKQRRIDELQEQVLKFLAPQPKELRVPPALHQVKPRGWDAYRAANRDEAEAGPDAGSEVPAVDIGIAAKQAAN